VTITWWRKWGFKRFPYEIEADFAAKVAGQFEKMITSATAQPATGNK